MPVKPCQSGGLPGYRCGDRGKCYTYSPRNEASRKRAKRRAILQCRAMDEPVEESDLEDAEWANSTEEKAFRLIEGRVTDLRKRN